MLEFCFYILSIMYDIISVVNNKISLVLQQIKRDKHPPDSIFVPSSAAVYLVVDLCCYWVFPSRKKCASLLTARWFISLRRCRLFAPKTTCVCVFMCVCLCVHFSDPAGYQDGARRAEMGSQSFRGRGEWELFFFFLFFFVFLIFLSTDTLFTTCSLSLSLFFRKHTHTLSLLYLSLTHMRTLAHSPRSGNRKENHPTDFWNVLLFRRCLTRSANMRLLAPRLARGEA